MNIKFYKISLILLISLISINLFSQTTIISSVVATNPNGSFENGTSTLAANGWTTVNDGTNIWIVGTATANSGTKSAYVSDGAGANNYSNAGGEVSHFYRDVAFPAGESCINLSFNWKSRGEVSFDYLRVTVVPTSVTPVAGTALSTGTIIGTFQNQTTWQAASNTLSSAYAGTTQRLVFSWINDNGTRNQPPAAVDNISLISSVPATPGCATYISPANNSTVCPSSQTLSWNALAAPTCGSITYDVYFNAGSTATTLVSSGQAGTTYATGAIAGGTTYSWRIVPKNGSVLATGCSTFSFVTNSISSSSVAPLTDNFESCIDWTFVNGAQTNQWVQGTATNNGGTQSIYISDNGGTTNTYNNGTGSVTHFYKDISFPAGQSCINLSFDWRADGEAGVDRLRVFGISPTVTPVAGTQLGTGQIGGNFNSQPTYQNTTLTLPSAFAGTTQRIVFSWRNDGSVGNNPPAAVDNISITTSVPPPPSCTTYSLPVNGAAVCNAGETLSWSPLSTPSCGSITYDVFFNAGTTATTLVSSAQTGTTYATGALTNGTTYAWRIVPRNGTVSASGCSTFTFLAVNNPTPNCVTVISPADGSNVCTTTQTLSWSAVASSGCGAITYDVYFNAGNTATTVVSSGQAGTTFTVGSLSSGVSYSWKVVAKSGTVSAVSCSDNVFTAISSQANDLPCNAVNIPLGTLASGDNNCTSNTGEPATPGCWTAGTVNSVWYSFTAPSSGNVKIRTAPGTLLSTQIAVYTGACGASMTLVAGACNQNAPNCGGTTVLLSELSLTGLTNGTTYYVAVDGKNSLLGTFGITVIESSTSYPITSGQICSNPNPVCGSLTQIGDPGNQGVGLTCDDPGSGSNCTGGERGSVWYTINIANTGQLNFVIIPNDYTAGTAGAETDYDFVLWKIGGTGAVSCAAIGSGTIGATACNYGSDGVTGVAPGGNAPAPYSNATFDNEFEPTVNVTAGETYVLLIENFSNSTKGFQLDLSSSGSSVISYTPPTTIIWTAGSNNTSWTTPNNWGGCGTPTCGLNAVISPISVFQPAITAAMGVVTVNNLTIDPGSVLTLGANAVLKICGNLTNNGTILSNPTSTIMISDDATHTFNGTLSGSSKLGNLIITDAVGGSNCKVITNSDVEIRNNFVTSNATSIFDLNGKNFTIGGDFINAAGANTFSNTTGSSFTFNGSGAQTYNPNAISASPTLTLNNVVANHVGTGITLSTVNASNMFLGTSGVLTLTAGKIITPNSQEVVITNTTTSAVSSGNTTSYVEGNLRRYLAAGATGAFDFPVGHATPGYERATVDFKTASAPGAIQLLAKFDPWGGTFPQPAIPNWSECSTIYDLNYLNHGYWSIDASSISTGSYDLTLYNRSYSNATGAGYSIAKSPSSAPSWSLNGNCVVSPVTAVQRTGMSGFSKMATVQGNAPLPVELISFDGLSKNSYNNVFWKSAVELNFKHYELESSNDGINFSKIATIQPIGNQTSINSYEYLDFNYFKPLTYYRLKMVDLDFTFEYSKVIAIEYGKNNDNETIVYPNPASNELYISLASSTQKVAQVNIYDIYGRVIYQQTIDLLNGFENTFINTSDFASGTYIININYNDSKSENIKIIINNKN